MYKTTHNSAYGNLSYCMDLFDMYSIVLIWVSHSNVCDGTAAVLTSSSVVVYPIYGNRCKVHTLSLLNNKAVG